MRSVMVQVFLLATCMLLGIMLQGDLTRELVIAMLCTLIVLAVRRLRVPVWLYLVAWAFICLAACVAAPFSVMLPLASYALAERAAKIRSVPIPFLAGVPAILIAVLMMRAVNATVDSRGSAASSVETNSALVYAVVFALACIAASAGLMESKLRLVSTQLRRAQDTERQQTRLLHRRISTLQENRERDLHAAALTERMRIAREIHDNVGHLLTRAIMQTQAAQVVANSVGEQVSAGQFVEISHTVDEAMTMVRRSVHDLADHATDFSTQIDQAAHCLDGADIDITVHNTVREAPANVAHCFTATIREAMTNIQRHSKATRATVTIRELPSMWQLSVQDNGGSIRRAGLPGIGVIDIEERARALGGTAVCGSNGGGWRVFVSIPKRTARATVEELEKTHA